MERSKTWYWKKIIYLDMEITKTKKNAESYLRERLGLHLAAMRKRMNKCENMQFKASVLGRGAKDERKAAKGKPAPFSSTWVTNAMKHQPPLVVCKGNMSSEVMVRFHLGQKRQCSERRLGYRGLVSG